MKISNLHTALIITLTILLFNSCGNSSSNMTIELIPVRSGSLFQYINREGEILINPQFKEAGLFHDGLALVKPDGNDAELKYIDKKGNYIFSDGYHAATDFSEGAAWIVKEDSYPTLINTKGEILFSLQNAQQVRPFSEGLAPVLMTTEQGSQWGFVNKKGEFEITPQFEYVDFFQEGKCAVGTDSYNVGYIDKSGKFIINEQFQEGYNFLNDMAIVSSDELKMGVIDEDGSFIVNPQYDWIEADGELFLISQDGKWGWINSTGKVIINPQFQAAGRFNENNLAPVMIGKKYGYVDKTGAIKINPQFDVATEFNKDMSAVKSGRNWGFIGTDGRYNINPQFKEINWDFEVREKLKSHIRTDFFDINGIIKVLNLSNKTNLPFDKTVSEFILDYPESDFLLKISNPKKLYKGRHVIEKLEANDSYTNIEFSIHSKPYTSVQDGWYSKKIYNPDAEIYKYEYRISFNYSSTGYGKIEKFKENLINNLLSLESFSYVEGESIYSTELYNERCFLKIYKKRSELRIQVTPQVKEKKVEEVVEYKEEE